MPSVSKIKYSEATLRQLAKARAQNTIYRPSLEVTSYEEIVDYYKKENKFQHSYDSYGRLTPLGKEKRLQELKEIKLPQNATIQEFLDTKFKNFMKKFSKTLKDIEKNWDGSYSPPKQNF